MSRNAIMIAFALAAMIAAGPAATASGWNDGYNRHPGYRERPYDRHRHYERHEHRGRHYHYRGHWRSWRKWDDYYRRHPWMREHGRYYREGGHLMFRVCDPDGRTCAFFSIGR